MNRNDFTMYLEDCKIQTRNYFGGNLLLQPAYEDVYTGDAQIDFPVATKITTDTFFLGTSPVINKEKTDYIETILDKFISQL